MVVNRHGNYLFGLFLSDNVFVQAGLDFMGGRNVMDIEYRFGLLFLRLFLFNLLLVGDPVVSLQVSQVDKAHIGIFPVLVHIIQHVHQFRIIQHSLVIILAHRIHSSVHAVVADTDIIGQVIHLAGLAFRASADKTNVLIFLFRLIRLFFLFIGRLLALTFFQARFLLFFFVSIIKIAHLAILRLI